MTKICLSQVMKKLLSQIMQPKRSTLRGNSSKDFLTKDGLVDSTGFADCIIGSGRAKSGGNEKNIVAVNEVILSQEDEPGSHQTHREMWEATRISRSTVQHIIKHDLNLRPFNTEVTKNKTEDEIFKKLTKGKTLAENEDWRYEE